MADRRLLRRAGWIALAVAVLLCVAGVFQHGLWTPDEPREAEIGRVMHATGYSPVPTLGGESFLEKPPLYAWITGAVYGVFGVSAAAARIPSTLFSIGAMLAAYLIGRRAAGRSAGVCAAVVLGTMTQFAETSHKAVLDTALMFFVAAGHLAFIRCQERVITSAGPSAGASADSVGGGRRGRGDDSFLAPYIAIGVLSGLAFLTKAWIGPALLCAPPIFAWAAMGDWRTVRRVLPRAFVAATVGVALFGLPWVFAVARTPGAGWDAVNECLVTEYVGRSVGGEEFRKSGHSNPPWYYATTALVVLLPWCLAIPAMLKSRVLSRTWRRGGALWCGLVFATGVVLLSLPSGKRDLYLVPLLPAAAVAIGTWVSRIGTRRGGSWDAAFARGLAGLAWGVLLLVGFGVAWASRGGALPSSVAEAAATLDYRAFGWGALVVGVVALLAAIVVRRVLRIASPLPMRTLWAMTLLFSFLHAAVRPLAHPLKDLAPAAREIARLVPADEPLLGLSLDETTMAVVPYFTGRALANVDDAPVALAKLEAGPGRHLVILTRDMTKRSLWKDCPDLKKRLRLVGSAGTGDRTVGVYEYTRP